MSISQGRTVLYVLSQQDADQINRRRTSNAAIRERIMTKGWPEGAQAHIGNPAAALDTYPMVVVRVWPDEFGPGVPGVNGQVFLDGNDALWVTNVREGTEPGTWYWPVRVPTAGSVVDPVAL
jgi:hypothetical protein